MGYVCSFFLPLIGFSIPNTVCILLLLPLILDGMVQLLFYVMSNNRRRLITGALFGIGFIQLVINVWKLF